jgi:CheY-like chemotaxis protein
MESARRRAAELQETLSQRKQLEQRLTDTAEELARANRMKDEFLSTLSHELRTPLSAILGWADLLMRGRLDPESSQRALEVIKRNALAQSSIISDVLDVSRIVSGKMRLDVRPVDLGEVLVAAIDTARPAADAKHIQIQTVVMPNLLAIADPDRLQQVFWTLLSNSVKFTPPNGRITLTAARTHGHLEVRVSDTGIGIPTDFLPHVFERFRQLDSSPTRTEQSGLGLGLAIVRHLTELHGGTVLAESGGEGLGATFVVTLPVRAVLDSATTERGVPEGGKTSAPRTDALLGLRLLVVDDQDDARTLIEAVLRDYGADVLTSNSALNALALIERECPHVMLADIGMPGIDGYELVRRVRMLPPALGRTTRCVALTAYGAPEDRRRALESGFDEHVVKPVMPEHLVTVVADVARTFPTA